MAETVLQKIVNRKHYKFLEEQVTWQEAVKLSTDSLVADGTVEPDYYKQIVEPDRHRLHGLQERHRFRHG